MALSPQWHRLTCRTALAHPLRTVRNGREACSRFGYDGACPAISCDSRYCDGRMEGMAYISTPLPSTTYCWRRGLQGRIMYECGRAQKVTRDYAD
ncbi:hypothetical protein MRB53_041343 [Persea americana]|nr:hypothetical protein MRB53_041343 [Persea americana]